MKTIQSFSLIWLKNKCQIKNKMWKQNTKYLTAGFVRFQLVLENPSSPEPIEPWNLIPEEQSSLGSASLEPMVTPRHISKADTLKGCSSGL